jgi:ACS family sodium-dependent inorganic phosphate cotransporter
MSEPLPRWAAYHTVVLLLCAAVFISYIDRTNISVGAIAMQAQLGWNETQKGYVLSAFFVGYLVLMVASAALANRYGGKVVLGAAVVWWSLFTILTPPAALTSFVALIGARIGLGVGEAAVFPASMNMIGRWVPLQHRSRAVALFGSCLTLGTVFALPVTGWLIHAYGWPMPFYVFGAAGLVWALVWFAKVGGGYGVEPPAAVAAAKPVIPWATLLRSPAVWAIIVNHFCHNWSLYLLLAWLPSYFKTTFGVSLASAGLLSAAPWLTAFVTANLAGYWADRMIRAGRSPTFVRKLMQTIGLGGAGVFLVLVTGAGSLTAGLLLMCCASGALGFCMGGFASNAFDIAPRYADVIWGLSNTAATIPGIVAVATTGWLVDRTHSYAAPLFVTAGIAIIGALVYLAIGSGEREID